MRNIKKIFNCMILIVIPILLVRLFVFGELSFNHHKLEYILLMVICLYFLITGIIKRRNSKPKGHEV